MKIQSAIIGVACALAAPVLLAQDYPAKSIRMVVPFPAGGGSDIVARVLGQRLSATLGQTMVADNRAGASGNIAAEIVARAPADGYTLLFANSSLSISPAAYTKLSFDPVKDFAPVSMVSSYPFVLVSHPSLPVKNVRDLIALAKAKPEVLTYSTAGAGTMSHFAMELFQLLTTVKLTHLPYKGAAPASIAVMAGEAPVSFLVLPVAQAQIRVNRLRGLGVAAKSRAAVIPQVPTMEEAGVKGHVALQWNGFFVPAATPRAIIDKLHRETVAALANAEVRQRLADEGAEPVGSNPAEFATFFRSEADKWGEVAKRSGTKLD